MGTPRPAKPAPPALSRRTLLRAGALGAAGLGIAALAGCASPAAASTDITFWHLMTGGDGERMNTIVNRVNRELTGARVDQTVLAWGSPYYTKLAMASAGGRAPDLGIMHLSRLAGYAPGGLLDAWDFDRMGRYGVSKDSFTNPTWDRMQFDGDTFAIALDSHAFVRFFNPEIADKAGVLGSDGKLLPTTTIDEFIEQAEALRGATGKLGLSYGWLGDGSTMWRLFWTFYTQLGGAMSMTGRDFRFDKDPFITAVVSMQKILSSKAVNRRSDGGFGFSAFTSGQTGEMLGGVWELTGLQGSKIPLDASPIPNLFGTKNQAAWGDSHAFVLPHQSDPDESRREKAYEAVSLILKASFPWAGAGHTPAYQPIVEEERFTKLLPNAHYAETAGYLQYDPALPFAGSGSNWQNSFGQAIQGALLGTETATQAMSSFERITSSYAQHAV